MPTKTKAKRTTRIIELPTDVSPIQKNVWSSPESGYKKYGLSKTAIISITLGIIILGLIAFNKGLIVAAIVNNKPIFRFNVDTVLVSRYGTQTLDNMITEQLINDEAARLGVVVTKAEIDVKQQEILTSFGGNVTLDEVLKFQGMTKTDFDQQIRLQILLTKILGKNITITDADVTKYITDNPTTLVATEASAMQKEAREAILTQKVGEQLQPWFTELKNKAKIYRFMK